MQEKTYKIIIVLVLLLLVVGGLYFFFFVHRPRAVANIVLQVNPEITLTIDEQSRVIGFITQEGALVGLNLVNKDKSEALRLVADALRGAGFLEEGRRILIAINPINNRIGEVKLGALNNSVDQLIREYLMEYNLMVEVRSVIVSADLAAAVLATGLSPVDYIDLIEEIGEWAILAMLGLKEGLGIDPVLFQEEFSTIAAALADMKEAGIMEGDAFAILRGALITDRSLEELTTITAAMIDLHEAGVGQEGIRGVFDLIEAQLAAGADRALLLEEFTTITAAMIDLIVDKGLTKEEALARIQAAITADPTLEEFDDLIEEPARPQPVPQQDEEEGDDDILREEEIEYPEVEVPQQGPAGAPGLPADAEY